MEKPVTLAKKLGMTEHVSGLLIRARRLGLGTPRDLETLAVQRGCRHYARGDEPAEPIISREQFSNEELATALLHICLPYDPQRIRIGAEMLSASGNDARIIARLAVWERIEPIVAYIVASARRFEPANPFWQELHDLLPPVKPPREGVLPHPTRFVVMTGITGPGQGGATVWLRPKAA